VSRGPAVIVLPARDSRRRDANRGRHFGEREPSTPAARTSLAGCDQPPHLDEVEDLLDGKSGCHNRNRYLLALWRQRTVPNVPILPEASVLARYGTVLTLLCQSLTMRPMEMFRPREIITRSRLWRDAEGEQWLLVFSFTLIRGRLECCGFEMRSFLRDRVPTRDETGPSYPASWDGDSSTLDKMKEPSRRRLDSAWPLPPDEPEYSDETTYELDEDGEDLGTGVEDCLPRDAGLGCGDEADFGLSPDMARPRPLRAATLRHLPLAAEMAKSRRSVHGYDMPHWTVSISSESFSEWLMDRVYAGDEDWAPERRRDGRVAKYSLDELKQVAAIYRKAYMNDLPPTQAVVDALNLTRDQAAKLVMKCRAAGLLGHTRRGARGVGLDEPQNDRGGSDDGTT